MKLILIGGFGLLGVFSRYFFGVFANAVFSPVFPVGTVLINLLGSFLIGVAYVLGSEHALISQDLRTGIMIGFLGGFTTFSSYCLECFRLAEEGRIIYCLLYLGGSPALGLMATVLGVFITRLILP